MIKRKVKNSTEYPNAGENQIEYDRQFLFRSQSKTPPWPAYIRNPLVRLLRSTQSKDAWDFVLKYQLGTQWYVGRCYPLGRRDNKRNMVVVDSQSINVFMALVCFYAIGYEKGVIEYSSDWQSEILDEEINARNS